MSRVWRCGAFELLLAHPLVMGILNVTPDSFSDGGEHHEQRLAVSHAARLAAEGADIIDVGGESTRPGAAEVSIVEELDRVLPVVRACVAESGPPVSIDTRHSEVARACVDAGAAIINDVSGFRDPAMVELAVGCDSGLVVMHMLGEPGTMQDEPRYDDVVDEVCDYLARRARLLVDAGVARERIAIDPGIGFGKTLEHNLRILARLRDIADLGYPVVVGASRKRFIGQITQQEDPHARLGGSISTALWSIECGAAVVRVHDVADTVGAVQVAAAIRGERA